MTFLYQGHVEKIPEVKYWYPNAIVYDPIKVGSIDGIDIEPHDAGILRAMRSRYKPNDKAKGDPLNTIFIGRLSLKTTEDDLEREFCRYGKMVALRLVRDIVTGRSKQYAFVEYKTCQMALNAYMCCKNLVLNKTEVLVDFECERLLPGWKPRRLGGGFGGGKESGQLRFGGRIRCFKPPINLIEYKKNSSKDRRKTDKNPVAKTAPSTSTRTHSTSHCASTSSAPSIISLPLTPPSNSSIVLPLTPPSNISIQLPLTPPPNPIILPLTPPPQPIVHLPLTPPSNSVEPLTPPPNINPPHFM